MAKTRMRSIYEALELIRKIDNETALTYNSIRKLCLDGKVKHFRSGKKIILNYDDLLQVIGMEEEV